MLTRRAAIERLGRLSAGTALAATLDGLTSSIARASQSQGDAAPPLAPGAPNAAERLALISAFRAASDGIEKKFEARTFAADWTMPYRLFHPEASGRLPLVVYLHGSGGLGDDNAKQLGLGNIFGTRLWALPEHQHEFPCWVLAPQTDRGWVRYGPPAEGDSVARVVPGLGDGARLVLAIIDKLAKELPIDERRIYVTGQSMGGAGVWHLLAERPHRFAAAAICCGSASLDDVAKVAPTPIWNFHGDADGTVPIDVSRARIAALRAAGGHPIHTEYAGVGHNAWEWAYTEPALSKWLFSKRLA